MLTTLLYVETKHINRMQLLSFPSEDMENKKSKFRQARVEDDVTKYVKYWRIEKCCEEAKTEQKILRLRVKFNQNIKCIHFMVVFVAIALQGVMSVRVCVVKSIHSCG